MNTFQKLFSLKVGVSGLRLRQRLELVQLDSVLITPHIGGHTEEAQSDVWTTVVARLLEELNDM